MKLHVILALILSVFASSAYSAAPAFLCDFILSAIHGKNTEPTQLYLNLVRVLISEKNALTAGDIEQLLAQDKVQNPLDILQLPLSPSMHFAVDSAFKELLTKHRRGIRWDVIKKELENQRLKKEEAGSRRDQSSRKTANLWIPVLKENKFEFVTQSLHIESIRVGGRALLIQNNTGGIFTLYDPITETTLLTEHDVQSHPATTLENGDTALLLHFNDDTASLYNLSSSNQVNLIYDKLVLPSYSDFSSGGGFFLEKPTYLKVNSQGEPLTIQRLDDLDAKNHVTPRGFLETNLQSEKQFFTPRLPGEELHVSNQGDLVKWSFEGNDLIVKSSSLPDIIHVPLKPSWGFALPREGLRLEKLNSQGLFFTTLEQVRLNWWWIDFQQKTTRYLGWQNNQLGRGPLYLESRGEISLIMARPDGSEISIYDADKERLLSFDMPEHLISTYSVILKKKTGEQLAFMGSGHPSYLSNTLMVFSFKTHTFLNLKLPMPVTLIDVYETDDGKIMGLFHDNLKLQTIQLFGSI